MTHTGEFWNTDKLDLLQQEKQDNIFVPDSYISMKVLLFPVILMLKQLSRMLKSTLGPEQQKNKWKELALR